MALTYPYPLSFLADCLRGDRINLSLKRNDEMSGSGDGRFWTYSLAKPLWQVSIDLYSKSAAHAREINAKIYALDGSTPFLWADPFYSGPEGGNAGGGVTVGAISADRDTISLAGLPAGFQITAGDYFSVTHTNGREYFATFAESGTAGGSGNVSNLTVRPTVPFGVTVGASVRLATPRMKVMIPPGGFQPFSNFKGRWGDGASISLVQKP